MKAIDEAAIKEKLALISQWRQSGQRLTPWCEGQGLQRKKVLGWLAYASRWQAKLAGHAPAGFKPIHVRANTTAHTHTAAPLFAAHSAQPTIRIELASHPWTLHWPISHANDLLGTLGICGAAQARGKS